MSKFDVRAEDFLWQQKIALRAYRWRNRAHPDFASAIVPIGHLGRRMPFGRIVITAHLLREPEKYCFALVYKSERILGLDVNPGRHHKNLLHPASVGGTHWQRWPAMEADPDSREQLFSEWFRDFFVAANVDFDFRIHSPPKGIQGQFRW